MISYITGKIQHTGVDYVIVVANGVGYKVNLPIPKWQPGQEVEVYIHTNVSQDDIRLWGFYNLADLDLFTKLISVSGVGPKSGANLVHILGGDAVVQAILQNNPIGLKVPGLGTKTAEKIIIELRNKVNADETNTVAGLNNSQSHNANFSDASLGLQSLGYSKQDADKMLSKVQMSDSDSAAELIKKALHRG
jgi:Holliday junction DNA helicase RuvA